MPRTDPTSNNCVATGQVTFDGKFSEYHFKRPSLLTEWVLNGESRESPAVLQIFAV